VSSESNSESAEANSWLLQSLEVCRAAGLGGDATPFPGVADDKMLQQYSEAALLGLAITRLRTNAVVENDAPPGVVDYVNRLAEAAAVAAESILRASGLHDSPTSVSFAPAWGRLARRIGLPFQEATRRFRWSFVGDAKPGHLPVTIALRSAHRNPGRPSPEFDVHLREALASLSADESALLAHRESLIREAYGDEFDSGFGSDSGHSRK